MQVTQENRNIRQQLEEESQLSCRLGQEIKQLTDQRTELESRLAPKERPGAGQENVAVIPVSGREEEGRLTISVNREGEEQRRKVRSPSTFLRSPPAGPSSLPVLSATHTTPKAGKKEVQVFQLELHCKNLEDQLDSVKFEIVKILSDKADFSKENAVLRSYQQAFIELELQNCELRRRLQEEGNRPETSQETMEVVKMIPDIDRSSPDGQEKEMLAPCHLGSSKMAEEEVGRLQQRLEVLEEEKRGLQDKVGQLEESLGLMQSEFESMEDYWQKKLEEERVFYEEQLGSSEQQFRELEGRMREYEELLPVSARSTGEESEEDKLSTIEETGSLEVQVTEWEEEIASLRQQLEEQERVGEVVMARLEEEWEKRLAMAEEQGREAVARQEELRWRLQDERAEGCECGAGGESSPRGQEQGWEQGSHLARSSSQSGLLLSQHLPHSPRQGPASLPAELVSSAHREVGSCFSCSIALQCLSIDSSCL